jgi:hypothetical protein
LQDREAFRNPLAVTLRAVLYSRAYSWGLLCFGGRPMKWFKHISDSLDDPFIFDLIDRFGSDGYLVFFGVLEIYSREFKTELDWNLLITRSQLRSKFHKRQDTLIINCLKHIQNSGKWNVTFKDDQVIIFIPKFTKIIDEWTKRKLSSDSVVTPKILRVNKNKEERSKNKDIKKIYKRKIPDVFPLTKELKIYALTKGILKNEVEGIFEHFKNHHGAKGTLMLDWNKCWYTWVRNEIKFNPEKYADRKEYSQESIEELCS